MNKKTIITALSLIAGTTFAFALDLDVKSNLNFNGKNYKNQSENSEKRNENAWKNKSATTTTVTAAEKIAALKVKGLREIDARIASLTNLNTRIQALTNVSATNKTTIGTNVQTQITALTSLRAKISADTDLAVLKTDVASITKSYRIYGLVMPKYKLAAKVDAHFATIANLATTSTRLSTDIQTAQTAGRDVTSLRTTLTSLNAKLADANTQSNAALTLVAPLLPDMGSTTVLTANRQVLTEAYAKYRLSLVDTKEVRSAAKNIIKQLKEWGVAVTATASLR